MLAAIAGVVVMVGPGCWKKGFGAGLRRARGKFAVVGWSVSEQIGAFYASGAETDWMVGTDNECAVRGKRNEAR